MKKAIITARAFDRTSGEPVCKSRNETIDLQTNELFSSCKSVLDIERAYESWWNELNPNSTEIVFVSRVKIA